MCFATRKNPACIVAILSSVIICVAVAMIALSVDFTGSDLFKAVKNEDGELKKL